MDLPAPFDGPITVPGGWSRPTPLGRPLVARGYLGAWIALVAALPLGLATYYANVGLTNWKPGSSLVGVNYHVYHVAAEAARAGDSFYQVHPPGREAYYFLYPPITVVAYFPLTSLEWTTGYAVVTALSVAAGIAATALIVDYVEANGTRLGWFDAGLVFALFALSTHAVGTLYFGNVNLLLGFVFALGFWALARDRDLFAGVAFALPALFKVFPVLFGVWLLRLRRWRAAAAWTATGVAGLLAGVLAFGLDTTVYYFREVLAGRGSSDAFVGGYPPGGSYYVTVQRPLSHGLWAVWQDAPYEALVALAALICVPVLAYFYRGLDDDRDRLMAAFATCVVVVVAFPALRFYLVLAFLPLVALLYLWVDADGGMARLSPDGGSAPDHPERVAIGFRDRTLSLAPGRIAFVGGGILLSLTDRPGDVVETLEPLPDPLHAGITPLVSVASLQLYGLAVMLAGCAWYRHRRRGVGGSAL